MAKLSRLREICRLILNMSDEEIQLSSIKCLTKKLQMSDKRRNVFAYPDPVPKSAKLKLGGNTSIYYHHLTASNTYMQYRIDFVERTQAHKNNWEQGA